MLRINLIEGESQTRDKKGRALYQIHPRVCVYGGAAHITTPLLKVGTGPYGWPIHSWAQIVVERGWGKPYCRVRKAPFWSNPVEN